MLLIKFHAGGKFSVPSRICLNYVSKHSVRRKYLKIQKIANVTDCYKHWLFGKRSLGKRKIPPISKQPKVTDIRFSKLIIKIVNST